MIITNKLEELIEYKILSEEKPTLEAKIKKIEKNLNIIDKSIIKSKIIAGVLGIDQTKFESVMVNYYNKWDKIRIQTALTLNKIEKRLLELEMNPYKK